MSDLISRADAIGAVHEYYQKRFTENSKWDADAKMFVLEDKTIAKDNMEICNIINALPSADAVPWSVADKIGEDRERLEERVSELEERLEWIPVSEMLPEDIKPVIVTWKNTDPKSYYQYIVGKHFIGTAHYKSGKWYWYSSVTEDLLAEYGKCDSEEFDEAIEVVAWMPLPTPYKGGDDE